MEKNKNIKQKLMNPYIEIARRHLTTEDLEMLLAERKKPEPKKMTEEQERRNYYRKYLEKHL